jgi:hypothetical protein
MRYHVNPCERPFEIGRWMVCDSDTGLVVATTSSGLIDALEITVFMNTHFDNSCQSTLANGMEALHDDGRLVSAEPSFAGV